MADSREPPARSELPPLWTTAFIVVATLLTLYAAVGGARDMAAALVTVAVMVGAFLLAPRIWRSRRAAAAAVVLVALLSPWIFGLVANTFQGWTDHVWYWGRYYNSDGPANNQLTDGEPAYSVLFLIGGSTWLPYPPAVADGALAPTGTLFRLPDGSYVSYSLVGGP